MQLLRQGTACVLPMGPFLDSTDGDTEEQLLAISQADIRLSKNGGAFAQTHNAAGAAHMEHGDFGVPVDTTDTDTPGRLRVYIHVAGAGAVWQDFMVVPAPIYDLIVSANLGIFDVETDLSQKHAMQAIFAMLCGLVDGAGTGTEQFKNLAGNKSRVTIETTEQGGRTSITFNFD